MLLPHPDLLAEEAFAWVVRHARLTRQPVHADPANKFIARSALQKAIRRGLSGDAHRHALELHRIDPAYLWRALTTVALEDVGFGSPAAVLWSTAALSKSFRQRVGELPLMSALIVTMCEAVKTRAACELSWAVDFGEPDTLRLFGRMTTAQLLSHVEAPDPYRAYAALAVVRGVLPKGLKVRETDWAGVEQASEIICSQVPAHAARAAVMALQRPLDNMALATFPAFRMAENEQEPVVVADDLRESLSIGGYRSEAYDAHESAGRKALRLFARQLRSGDRVLASMTDKVATDAVSSAVFIEEGALLDRWQSGVGLGQLRIESDAFTMTRHGVSVDQAFHIRQLVREHIPALNDARQAIAA